VATNASIGAVFRRAGEGRVWVFPVCRFEPCPKLEGEVRRVMLAEVESGTVGRTGLMGQGQISNSSE
jgi:hypothetical protein